MLRLVVAFVVVVNAIMALWSFGGGGETAGGNQPALPSESGDQLILLAEIAPSELRLRQPEPAPVAPAPEPEPVAEEVAQPCVLAGPFGREGDARALADQVGALGVMAEILTETLETPGPIMVYIPPFASAQEARRELRVLQSSDIDSFVIAEGELENGISLGVFSTEANAVEQQGRLRDFGYSTRTRQFTVETDRYYVNFSGEVLGALENDYWPNIAREYSDIRIEQKACDEVASAGKFL